MIGVLFALGAGVGFGCSNVIGRMAMDRSSVFATAFWSVAVTSAVLLVPMALLVVLRGRPIGTEALVHFVIAGVVADFTARSLLFSASERLGASRASGFRVLAPIVTLCFGAVAFGDTITWTVTAGVIAMLAGLTLLNLDRALASSRRSGGAPAPPVRQGVAFGLVAAVAFGSGDLLRQAGIDAGGDALVGAFVTATTAMTLHIVRGVATGRMRRVLVPDRATLPLLAATGACILVALVCFLLSLRWLPAGVAATVSGTQVLFAIVFGRVLNQRVERVTARVLAGGVIVVAGLVVVLAAAP